MSKNNKVVLVGAGYWGTNIAKNLVKLNKKFLVCDLNKKKSNLLKKRFPNNIIVNNNFKKLLKEEKNNHFIFATPPSKNFKLIKLAIKNNKKIFIEKPGFKNTYQIQKLKKLFPQGVKNLTFGYIYLFNTILNF